MNISLDISQIVYRGTGVGRYTRGLVDAILTYDHGNQWTFFFSSLRQRLDRKLKQKIKERGFMVCEYKVPPSLLSLFWNKWHIFPVDWIMPNLDWFISSDWTEPPAQNIKKATIVHDLAFLKYPETVDWKIIKTQSERLIHVAKESNLIFADSISTKKDIGKLLSVKAPVEVVYPGVQVISPPPEKIKQTLAIHRLKKSEFILAVGKREPRKNLERLIQAYLQLPRNLRRFPLVIVGPKGWGSLELSGENVQVIGYLSDLSLYSLYESCLCFVYPSLYEGFGYPLIEAGLFKAPSAVSNSSSLRELGQGSALLFNPLNAHDISLKLESLITNKELRDGLKSEAYKKAVSYSWEQTLKKLIYYLHKHS